uniref:Uncharacterized protein n=1 Tax=Parastrongyloides trichosuri TaxID=131310 RepID=A0A0N4ZCD0_PARTI
MWIIKYIIFLISYEFGILHQNQKFFVNSQQNDIVQTAGDGARLVGDILKLFVDKQKAAEADSGKIASSNGGNIFSSFNQFTMPPSLSKTENGLTTNFDRNNALPQQKNVEPETWKLFAKQMLNMFGPSTTTPPPKINNFFSDTIGKYLNNFGEQNNKEVKPLIPMTISPETQQTLFGNWANLFSGNNDSKNKQKIDTGNGNFDRLVIREKADGGSFFENLVGTKWNERGLQWTDGNIRLVNKKGKDILGSEVSVHDRSIDIPVQQWFNIAENLLGNVGGH